MKLVESRTPNWEFWYGLLLRYVDGHGHAAIKADEMVDEWKLGQWASIQRQANRRGELTIEHKHRLARLPGWSWDPKEDQWEQHFAGSPSYATTDTPSSNGLRNRWSEARNVGRHATDEGQWQA